MSKLCVMGSGFIGSALKEKLLELGHEVSWFPQKDTEIVFFFKGPTHPDFDKNPDYWRNAGIYNSIFNYCREKNVKVIYASSALVYEPESALGKYMSVVEGGAPKNSLGLRLFPVYGSGGHTVVDEWRNDIINNKRPIVYGNGKQTRDFIYINNAIDQIISVMGATGIVDIGTGILISFNEIIKRGNEFYGTKLKPKYVKAPKGYRKEGVVCKYPLHG